MKDTKYNGSPDHVRRNIKVIIFQNRVETAILKYLSRKIDGLSNEGYDFVTSTNEAILLVEVKWKGWVKGPRPPQVELTDWLNRIRKVLARTTIPVLKAIAVLPTAKNILTRHHSTDERIEIMSFSNFKKFIKGLTPAEDDKLLNEWEEVVFKSKVAIKDTICNKLRSTFILKDYEIETVKVLCKTDIVKQVTNKLKLPSYNTLKNRLRKIYMKCDAKNSGALRRKIRKTLGESHFEKFLNL